MYFYINFRKIYGLVQGKNPENPDNREIFIYNLDHDDWRIESPEWKLGM